MQRRPRPRNPRMLFKLLLFLLAFLAGGAIINVTVAPRSRRAGYG